jgi:CRP/FNR family transcriptional regulator, cyclic AMP receptor protein
MPRIPVMKDIIAAKAHLSASPWFSALPPDLQAMILKQSQWRRYRAGEHLSTAGDALGGLFGVGSGVVHISGTTAPAAVKMLNIFVSPFWYFSRTLLPGEQRIFTVVAQTNVVSTYLPQAEVLAIMNAEPAFWWHILRNVSQLVTLQAIALSDALISDKRLRCIAVLLRVSGRRRDVDAPDTPLVAHVGHDDLAGMANVSRQTLGDVLRALEADGLVKLGYRQIVVVSPSTLQGMLHDI